MKDEAYQGRMRVYALLITLSAAMTAARILAAELVLEPSIHKAPNPDVNDHGRPWPALRPPPLPIFSSNDRSRWAAVRALVDGDPKNGQPPGTFVVGRRDRKKVVLSIAAGFAASSNLEAAILADAGYRTRIKSDSGIIFEPGWESVDKIMNPATLEFYSTKPPLLTVIVAGLYWLLQWALGWTLETEPFAVVRTVLMLINWLPFIAYLGLLARFIERLGRTDWGRIFALSCAAFGTLLTPFIFTLNNDSVATYCVVFALYPMAKIMAGDDNAIRHYLQAGFFAGLTACFDLPASAFTVLVFAVMCWRLPRPTLTFFLPAALVPLAAAFAVNYLTLGEWLPAYFKLGGPWYEFEGAHFRKPLADEVRFGIDWAWTKETRAEYAFHFLLGHHGLFTLTPIWILAVLGMLRSTLGGPWLSRSTIYSPEDGFFEAMRQYLQGLLAVMTLILTVVVVGFYLVKSDNYSGWSSGLRWLMWLSPLWVICLLPAADWLAGRRGGRIVGYTLLAVAVFSASYPAANPWRHPWLYRLMEALGWQSY